jgi:hypothetical protein
LLNQRLNPPTFVESGIISDQLLSGSQSGNQADYKPGFKDNSITSPFNRKGGHQLMVAIGRDHIHPALVSP